MQHRDLLSLAPGNTQNLWARSMTELASKPPWYTYVFAAAAGFQMLLFWLIGLTTDDPMSVVAMYRYGDSNYFPLLRGLADLELGETLVLEHHGQNVQTSPFLPLALHALCFKALGIWGIALADVVVSVAYYAVLNMLLRTAMVRSPVREVLALSVSCRLIEFVFQLGFYSPHLWGYRIPRPFITEIVLVLCLVFLIRLFVLRDRQTGLTWGLFGLTFAALLQSNIFSVTTVGICTGAGFLYLWVFCPQLRGRRFFANAGIFAAVAVIASFPLLMQRLLEHPDVSRRFGVFPVSRSSPLFIFGWMLYLVPVALGYGLLMLALQKWGRASKRQRQKMIGFFAAVCVAAYAAMPLSSLLLGQSIQHHHFRRQLNVIISYTGLLYGAYAIQILWGILAISGNQLIITMRRWFSNHVLRVATVFVFVGGALFLSGHLHLSHHHASHQVRVRYDESGSLTPYRRDFSALIQELMDQTYADCEVLGGFDNLLLAWWVTFQGRHVFLPNACLTTLLDKEIERRLALLCAGINMTGPEFRQFINRRSIIILWLGCYKYQATTAYTFAPLSEYSPEDQERILASSGMEWQVIVPPKELERLERMYNQLRSQPMPDDRLDLIVLTNDDNFRRFAPAPERFRMMYENPTFRVYRAMTVGDE